MKLLHLLAANVLYLFIPLNMKHFLIVFFLIVCIKFLNGQVSFQNKISSNNNNNNNNEITIEVTITKGAIGNFAKFQVDVPAGVLVTEGDSKTGIFSFENNRAKIIWVSLPSEPELMISYKIISSKGLETESLFQKFFYIENGLRQEVEVVLDMNTISSRSFETKNQSSDVVISSDKKVDSINSQNKILDLKSVKAEENLTTTQSSITLNQNSTIIEQSINKQTPPEFKQAVTSSSNYVYKVQIGAFKTNPGIAPYKGLKGISIKTEAGLYKVFVGNFSNKEEALKTKDELSAKGVKGFLVVFENGNRLN